MSVPLVRCCFRSSREYSPVYRLLRARQTISSVPSSDRAPEPYNKGIVPSQVDPQHDWVLPCSWPMRGPNRKMDIGYTRSCARECCRVYLLRKICHVIKHSPSLRAVRFCGSNRTRGVLFTSSSALAGNRTKAHRVYAIRLDRWATVFQRSTKPQISGQIQTGAPF